MRIFPAVLIFSALTFQCSANAEELLESDLSRGQLFSKYILSQAPGGGQILSLDGTSYSPTMWKRSRRAGVRRSSAWMFRITIPTAAIAKSTGPSCSTREFDLSTPRPRRARAPTRVCRPI